MCPECFATMALLVTGVVSTGGAAAATAKIFRNKRPAGSMSRFTDSLYKHHLGNGMEKHNEQHQYGNRQQGQRAA